MSDGLNSSFKKDVLSFMRNHVIDIKGQSELEGDSSPISLTKVKIQQGIHDFDLEYAPRGEVYLRHFNDREKIITKSSNKIRAYWLPWESRNSTSIQLGNEADFFFTSALAGCRIQIGSAPNPLVMHIAGDMNRKEREKHAAQKMPDYENSRRFSVSTEYNATQLAFLVGHVIKTGFTRQRQWRFVAQGIRIGELNGKTNLEIANLTDLHPGTIIL